MEFLRWVYIGLLVTLTSFGVSSIHGVIAADTEEGTYKPEILGMRSWQDGHNFGTEKGRVRGNLGFGSGLGNVAGDGTAGSSDIISLSVGDKRGGGSGSGVHGRSLSEAVPDVAGSINRGHGKYAVGPPVHGNDGGTDGGTSSGPDYGTSPGSGGAGNDPGTDLGPGSGSGGGGPGYDGGAAWRFEVFGTPMYCKPVNCPNGQQCQGVSVYFTYGPWGYSDSNGRTNGH